MSIKGNTVGTTTPRTNYEQTNPAKADYLKGKDVLDAAILAAQKAANDAKTAAGNAKTAADNAQTTANKALPKAGGTMTGALNVLNPTENAHAANKGYVDEKRKLFTTTLTVNDWEGNTAPYTQTIGIEGILSTDMPHYGPVYSENSNALLEKENWALVDDLITADNSVVFVCFEEKPAVGITVQLEVFR